MRCIHEPRHVVRVLVQLQHGSFERSALRLSSLPQPAFFLAMALTAQPQQQESSAATSSGMRALWSFAPEAGPLFLGGSCGDGAHPVDTTLSNLSRPRELPPLVTRSFKASKSSKQVKVALKSLSTEKGLSIDWEFVDGKLALIAKHAGEQVEVTEGPLFKALFAHADEATRHANLIGHATCNAWEPLKKALSEKDRGALQLCLLHLTLCAERSSLGWGSV